MHMQMINCLTARFSMIPTNGKPIRLQYFLNTRHRFFCTNHYRLEYVVPLFKYRRTGRFGNNQCMPFDTWMNIKKCEAMVVFVYFVGRNFSGDDFVKNCFHKGEVIKLLSYKVIKYSIGA